MENLADNVSVTGSQRSRSRSVAPKAPVAKKSEASVPNPGHTSKVVERDFSPKTLKVALASKSHVRTRTIFDEPFPRNNKIARINFAWKTIKEAAFASEDVKSARRTKELQQTQLSRGNS